MDLIKVVVAVERSNISSEYRGFVIKAVQEYIKEMERAQAIKPNAMPVIDSVIVNEPTIAPVAVKKTRKKKI